MNFLVKLLYSYLCRLRFNDFFEWCAARRQYRKQKLVFFYSSDLLDEYPLYLDQRAKNYLLDQFISQTAVSYLCRLSFHELLYQLCQPETEINFVFFRFTSCISTVSKIYLLDQFVCETAVIHALISRIIASTLSTGNGS